MMYDERDFNIKGIPYKLRMVIAVLIEDFYTYNIYLGLEFGI